jgi:hypothetical protein
LIKYFRFTLDDILWKYSWKNLTMFMLSIPRYESEGDHEGEEITDISELGDLLR